MESRIACASTEEDEYGLLLMLTPIPIAVPTGVVRAKPRPKRIGLMSDLYLLSLIRVPRAMPSKNYNVVCC